MLLCKQISIKKQLEAVQVNKYTYESPSLVYRLRKDVLEAYIQLNNETNKSDFKQKDVMVVSILYASKVVQGWQVIIYTSKEFITKDSIVM